jgi:acetylornithine deacetylase
MNARELLARLVAFPTVSSASNLDLVGFVRDYLAGLGAEIGIVPSPDGRKANLWASFGPRVPGGVILSGHTDVVPAEGQPWTHDPWVLREESGRLYGRGASDMKGFDAAVLAAAPAMAAVSLARPIHIALTYDEEVGCLGAPSLIAALMARLPPPEAAIVGEPTRLVPVTGHKGTLSFYTNVTGRSVHSSRIDQGVSAVMTAARLVTWFDDALAVNRATADPRSQFAPPYTTLHCGMIEGGTAPNIVAGSCRFVTDIRAIPTENAGDYRKRYEVYIREEIEPHMKRIAPEAGISLVDRSAVPGLRPEPGGAAERLVCALAETTRTEVVSYATEAGLFQAAGCPTVVCGPGDIAQAHTPDEFIEVDQLEAGTRFIQRLVTYLSA